jgi:hypothetical protein
MEKSEAARALTLAQPAAGLLVVVEPAAPLIQQAAALTTDCSVSCH